MTDSISDKSDVRQTVLPKTMIKIKISKKFKHFEVVASVYIQATQGMKIQ